ncbi:MBL fold metallo-hydrolase [Lutispora thermophila]|mgnify:CR=1 FL=1|uniref:L-ascorbate metabolism protein UlaG, beta-lactamase superfamily n=1 Tax=Lutispora thermophila DSM 19022 TaxID=1122184 RepID=A0A1M6H309_9FIRM|nr:L-ascorbate metabolism protein UlaG, beta-lactamase superfamily [Lutispora thermophila DSM 19022]
MKNVKIQYLFNSGFSVETEKHQLIFDYYKGSPRLTQKDTIVFASHGHPDHYNPDILKWKSNKENIKYIFSHDIQLNRPDESITFMSPDEETRIDDTHIKALGSTDLGVSFLIAIDGLTIFHAGDLNWWYWWDDTPEEIRVMEEAFKKEIHKLRDTNINIAFFPVDPRLRHNYSLGGEYFIKEIRPEYFIPMHFGEDYAAIKSFMEKVKDYSTKVVEISAKDQEINL